MKLFSGSANQPLAEKIAHALQLSLSKIELHTFPDGEQRVMLEENVVGEDVVLIQPTGIPTDTNYMQLFFMIDAARRSGAKSITVVIPYIGYQRQDHVFREGEARSLEVVIRFMEQTGAARFIGVDTHSVKIPELFIKPFTHVSALPLFAKKIKEEGLDTKGSFLVTPDMGGIRRIKQVSEMLKDMPYAAVEKNRDLASGHVAADTIHGEVHKNAIIIDDMISSGGTIKTACELLHKKGAEKIYVFATHAVFSEKAPELLQNSLAEKVLVTDTIEVPEKNQFEKLEIISIADVIAEQLKWE